MNRNEKRLMTEEFVRQNQKGYDSGHDWWHIVRVRKLAKFINENEMLADPFTVDITALLHDTADSKFTVKEIERGYLSIKEFLERSEMSDISDEVISVIKNVSFSSKDKKKNPDDHLLWVIQDADRLDAIGAIGIARAFNYGGFRNNKIYIPEVINPVDSVEGVSKSGTSSTISHFYEKLLLLKYRMNTLTAKKLAAERHEFLEIYLNQFYKEWDFNSESHSF
jgi:uncharacterized protein